MAEKEYRRWAVETVQDALRVFRAVFIAGARQCGKTTLTRQLMLPGSELRSLDNSTLLAVANEDPAGFVKRSSGGTLVVDEVQKAPLLLQEIKLAVDADKSKGQYLLTGSADIKKLPAIKESLAGRMGTMRLRPLVQGEVIGNKPTFLSRAFERKFSPTLAGYDKASVIDLAFRGGYGETFDLPERGRQMWFKSYLDALLLHDIRDLMDIRSYQVLRKLMEDLLGRSARFFEAREFTTAYGIRNETFVRYLSVLKTLYLLDEVEPWHASDYDGLGKRSKYFAADTGMMATMLGWKAADVNFDSDRAGKLVETWVYNQLVAQIDLDPVYTITQYRDKQKREIDFVITADDGAILGIEVKAGSHVGKSDFNHLAWFRDHLAGNYPFTGIVVYTGETTLPFGKDLYAVPIGDICG